MSETVAEFLERAPNPLPALLTVERTTQSKYLFYCLVRHYRKRVKGKPIFITHNKAEADQAKAAIEEHSLWNEEETLYILEGFSLKFVEGLHPPPKTFILAETDGGMLKAESYSFRQKRNILKILYQQLALDYNKDDHGHAILTLRGLLKLDWTAFRSYEEFEPTLRKAKIMAWTDEELEKELATTESGNVLTLIKRGQFREIFDMSARYGAPWVYNHITELLGELLHYRSLRTMGYDEQKCARELGVEGAYRRAKELEEANQMLTADDLLALAERTVQLDPLAAKNPELGLAVFCLNAPIRMRR